MATNSVDFNQMVKDFSNMVFQEFNKKLSDKDPILLQFLLYKIFAKHLDKSLTEYIAISKNKLEELADLWEERENESFNKLNSSVEKAGANLSNLFETRYSQELAKLYENSKNSLTHAFDEKQKEFLSKLKFISTVVLSFTGIGGIAIGLGIAKLIM